MSPRLRMGSARKLGRAFFARDTLVVASDLVGMHLVRCDEGVRRVGRIVETEAYRGPEDKACHARFGRTARAAILFGPPGYAYVYLIYGMYHCLNFVTERDDYPGAVLIRAVEPVAELLGKGQGPGLLCNAMRITRAENGTDLTGDQLFVEEPANGRGRVRLERSARIGVDYAAESAAWPWRFFDADSPFVSTSRRAPAGNRRNRRSSSKR